MNTPRPEQERYVLVGHLAEYLGQPHIAIRLKRNGAPLVRVRDPESGRLVYAVTPDEAKRIIENEKSKPVIVRPESL